MIAGVELAQRARRRRCADWRKIGSPAFCALLVQRREIRARHVDLAAHLEHVGRVAPFSRCGMSRDGAQVGGDVLAAAPSPRVAPRTKLAVLVAQRADSPSIFGSAMSASRLVVGSLRKRRMRADELAHVLVGEGVVERQHRHARGVTLAKPLGRRGADPLARAVGADQSGKRASIASLRRRSAS